MTTEKTLHTLIDQNTVAASWNGSPSVINTNQNNVMPQTPDGTTIFTATNQSTMNNQGLIALTSGGGAPTMIDVPALTAQPTVNIGNWKANNLSVTNISNNNNTPILIQAVGPGMPGITPLPIVIGTPLMLAFGQCAQVNALPQYMQLVIQSTSAMLGIVGVIGGSPDPSSGNNGYVIGVNSTSGNTGPGTGNPAPPGYFATSSSNTYAYQFNWGSSLVFVANLSPSTPTTLSVLLRAL